MWGRKTKEERAEEAKENQKEKAIVENRLTDVEKRVDVLSDRVSVISRQYEEKNT